MSNKLNIFLIEKCKEFVQCYTFVFLYYNHKSNIKNYFHKKLVKYQGTKLIPAYTGSVSLNPVLNISSIAQLRGHRTVTNRFFCWDSVRLDSRVSTQVQVLRLRVTVALARVAAVCGHPSTHSIDASVIVLNTYNIRLMQQPALNSCFMHDVAHVVLGLGRTFFIVSFQIWAPRYRL